MKPSKPLYCQKSTPPQSKQRNQNLPLPTATQPTPKSNTLTFHLSFTTCPGCRRSSDVIVMLLFWSVESRWPSQLMFFCLEKNSKKKNHHYRFAIFTKTIIITGPRISPQRLKLPRNQALQLILFIKKRLAYWKWNACVWNWRGKFRP